MKMDLTTLMFLAGGAALVYYLYQQQPQAAPLAIYPSLGWTVAKPTTSSMAKSSTQKASTVIAPLSLYSSAQQQNQSAMLSQCVGAYPGCTPLTGDTQLGF
jgi:hypothetical protein